jgi:hypothetical protein
MDMRDYDPAIGRWTGIDPVTHFPQSPYNAFDGNPVTFADPSGADGVVPNIGGTIYGMAGQSTSANYGGPMGGHVGVWMGSHSEYEMSYEGHFLNSIFTFNDPSQIRAIYNYYSKQNGIPIYSTVSEVGPIQNGYGEYGNTLNPDTVGKQFFGIGGLTYPGPTNPKTYNGRDDYSYIPSRIEEFPAFIHDRAYDVLQIKGASGLFMATDAINADWRFVASELKISAASNNIQTKFTAAALGVGLGLIALPKTVHYYSNPVNWFNY